MTLAINTNDDGSITMTDNQGVTMTAHNYDLPAIAFGLAHADSKHLAHSLASLVTAGRVCLDTAWAKLTAAKSTLDAQNINVEISPEAKASLLTGANTKTMTTLGDAIVEAHQVFGSPTDAPQGVPVSPAE